MYVTVSLKIEIDASASLSEVPPTIGCCQTRRAQGSARHTPCRDEIVHRAVPPARAGVQRATSQFLVEPFHARA
jgi:hypothetical protein